MKVLDAKVDWRESFDNPPDLEVLVDEIPTDLEYDYIWGKTYTAIWYAQKDGYVSFFAHPFKWKFKMGGGRWSSEQHPKNCPHCGGMIDKDYLYSNFVEAGTSEFGLLCQHDDHLIDVKVLDGKGYAGREFNLKHVSGNTATIVGPWSSNCAQIRKLGLGNVYPVSITEDPEVMERGHTFTFCSITREKIIAAAKKANVNLIELDPRVATQMSSTMGDDQMAIFGKTGGLFPSLSPYEMAKPRRTRSDGWKRKTYVEEIHTLHNIGEISMNSAIERKENG